MCGAGFETSLRVSLTKAALLLIFNTDLSPQLDLTSGPTEPAWDIQTTASQNPSASPKPGRYTAISNTC